MLIQSNPLSQALSNAARSGLRIIAVAAIASAVSTSSAFADSEVIQFDFTSGSSISILGGVIVTPPDGTLDSGSARIEVEATAPGVYVPGGNVDFSQVQFAGTVAKIIPGQADISGPYSGNQVGVLSGTLAAGMNGADFANDLVLDLNIVLGCTGGGCGVLGFPISEIGQSLLGLSFLPITDLGLPGSAKIEATIPVSLDGVQGTLNLVGLEVNRFFVPEPGTFLLVGLGLFGLGRSRMGRRV